ncbi:MAG: hypothetical protein MJ227_03310 [Bacilli bacterium]|nr:hypothetical protein [Bacilli bacterium]
MINIFISLMFATVMFSTFTVTTELTSVNRVFMNIPVEYIETSVPIIKDPEHLSFSKEKLEHNIYHYFDVCLSKYVKSFSVTYYYYNASDKSYCIEDECSSVKITLDATVAFNINYNKSVNFQISEVRHG